MYTSGTDLRLFVYEKSGGKRKFLVTSQEEFRQKYASMQSYERHFYEVIENGRRCPLFFDVEYVKTV